MSISICISVAYGVDICCTLSHPRRQFADANDSLINDQIDRLYALESKTKVKVKIFRPMIAKILREIRLIVGATNGHGTQYWSGFEHC